MQGSDVSKSDDTTTDLDAMAIEKVGGASLIVRGMRVLLDSDLAALYGVTTKSLNQAIKRNAERFPADFMFRLTINDLRGRRSQSVTASNPFRNPRFAPHVFTEHGAIMAAMLLNSSRAIEMSVYVVRTFVRMRELMVSDQALTQRLAALERSLVSLDANTRRQFKEVYDAIRALTAVAPRSRPIGFTADIGPEE